MNENIILMNPAESLPFLQAIYAWGIAVIQNIQIMKSPALTTIMKLISSLGNEFFYIVIVLLIFWCVDEKRGFRLGLVIIISAWINSTLKFYFNQPRPFNFVPALGLAFEPSNGFPSGHAQVSMSFWITTAFLFAKGKLKTILWTLSVVLILLIGFSRLYLGVHFPTDVFGGWIFACIVMVSFYFIEKNAAPVLQKTGKRPQLIITAVAALLMNAIFRNDTSLSAMLLGFCAGYSLMIKHFPYDVRSSKNGKAGLPVLALRSVTGIAGFFVIYQGLKMVFPGDGSLLKNITFFVPYYELFRFIRYGLLGLWASAGAILVFMKFGLAASVTKTEPKKGE